VASEPGRRVIDSHVHVWAEPQPGRRYPWPARPDPNPIEAFLPVLDAAGVERAVQVTPSTSGYDNGYGLEVAERHPERVSVFGRIETDKPDVRARLADWMAHPAAAGVRVTFLPEAGGAADDPLRHEAFWAAAEELDLPVAVFAPGGLDRVVRVAERHPRLRLIVDHLGLDLYGAQPFAEFPLLRELAPLERVRVKVSGLVETSAEAFPFRDVHERLAQAVELFGSERLIWGSNYPVVLNRCSYAESLEYLGACEFLSARDLDQLLHRTFSAAVAA
jgi:L-fuconolactonase